MLTIINKNEREPAMLYEAIACHALNCDGLQDSKAIADLSFFDVNFVPSLTHEGMEAMYSVMDQLIKKESNKNKIEEYYTVRNSLEVGMDKEISIDLLTYLADLINE